MLSTFSGFEVAKSGLNAARANLQITAQNMTNAHSKGYTRQRLDTYAMGSTTGSQRYASINAMRYGQGVSIGGITQLRDPYLDAQYRTQQSKVAASDKQLGILNDIQDMFGDATKSDMATRLTALSSAISKMTATPNDLQAEGAVKAAMQSVIQLMNTMNTANFDSIRQQEEGNLRTGAIEQSNNLLRQVATLNEQIKNANVVGDPALELLDQRNLKLDELSQYMNIQVNETSVDVGGGRTVPELTVTLIGKDGARFNLIDNNEFKQLEMVKAKNGNIEINLMNQNGTSVASSDDGKVSLDGGLLNQQFTTGTIAGSLAMLNEKGDYDFSIDDLKKLNIDALFGTKLPDGTTDKIGMGEDIQNMLAELNDPLSALSDEDRAGYVNRLNQYFGSGTVTDTTNAGVRTVSLHTSGGGVYTLASDHNPPTPLSRVNIQQINGKYELSISDGLNSVNLTDKLNAGALNSSLTTLNSRQAYDTSVPTKKGIGYYEGLLDSFAFTLADQFNTLNGEGKPLFSSSDGGPINSNNIQISDQWKNATGIYITADGEGESTAGNNNLIRMQDMIDNGKFDFNTTSYTAGLPGKAGSNVYTHTLNGNRTDTATFQGFLTDVAGWVGTAVDAAGTDGDVYLGKLDFIQQQRDSISKVNQDEEGVNLIMFNQALTAASRVMTTLDTAMETIISKMGVVGR